MTIKTTAIALGALIVASTAGITAASAGPAGPAGNVNFAVQIGTPNVGVEMVRSRGGYRHALPPHAVRRILHRHGYRDIRSLDRRGPVYVAVARGYRGALYNVQISARNGRILSQDIVWRGPRHGGGWGGPRGGHGGQGGFGIYFGF
jgi:hypothetical protein